MDLPSRRPGGPRRHLFQAAEAAQTIGQVIVPATPWRLAGWQEQMPRSKKQG